MQSGDLPSKKISRIRTFQNDISSVRPTTTNQPSISNEKAPVIETATEKEKLSAETIFRAPKTTNIPVAKPQIPEAKITEAPALPPVTITEKSIPETPIAKPILVPPLEKVVAATENKPLTPIVPKEALAAIVNDDISEVISDDTSAEGSVITDQKRTRFSLTSSIITAVKAWFVDEKESIKYRAETKRKAIPTVRPVEKRKEILQKAAEQSAMAPRDDHMQLATKFALPKTKTKEDDAPIQIKKKAAREKPSWSHFTEKENTPVPEEKVAPATPSPEKVPPQTNGVFLPPIQVKEKSVEPKPITPLPTEVVEVVETKSTPSTVPSIPAAIESKPPAVKVVGNKNKVPFKGFGRFFTYAGVAVVIIIAITSGAGLVWWLFSNVSQTPTLSLTEENVPPEVAPELVSYEDSINIILPLRKEDLWQSILSVEARAGSDLVLVSLMNHDNTPATASKILSTINWPSDAAFSRNIEEINFGQYRGVTFIVIRATNFDSVFGGLLSAESTMPEDLDIFIKDNAETLADRFVDELIQNHDIRVLKTESGSDALVYGFVNRNTIIITSDRNTFSEVANQVR
jgi:hypothetical protein